MNVIKGNNFIDARGKVHFVNDFDLTPVKRMYRIVHPDVDVIRAWQVHRLESKWFQCVRGAFWVQIADLATGKVHSIELTAHKDEVLYIPKGQANGFKALQPDSELLVFSDLTLEKAKLDNEKAAIGTYKETWVK